MSEIDASKYENYRLPKNGEWYVSGGVIQRACADHASESSGPHVILVPKAEIIHSLSWAVSQMVEHPREEYTCDESNVVSRYDKDCGFQYRPRRESEWRDCGSFVEEEKNSTSWHAVAKDGRDWLRSLEDGVELDGEGDTEVLNGTGFHWVKRGDYVIGCRLDGSEFCRLRIDQVNDSGWSLRPKPAPGSREEVAASAVGSCWWVDDLHIAYRKRTANGSVAIKTLTGELYCSEIPCGHLPHGVRYTQILDLSGQPAEPKFDPATGTGNQLWAQVCCRDLGKKVTHRTYRPKTDDEISHIKWDGKQFVYFCNDGLSFPSSDITNSRIGIFGTGWSLYSEPAHSPLTLESLAAEVRELRAKLEGKVA